jgi:hypothetical protein
MWWCCPGHHGSSASIDEENKAQTTALATLTPEQIKEYEEVQYMSKKREIKVTIRKGTQAGVAAGLCVMAGVIVAGPVGAAVGGAAGTALAVKMSKDVVPLNDLLEKTPYHKRGEVLNVFRQSFQEEFMDTINGSPELKLLLSGASIFGVVRYMMDRNMLESEQLEKIDKLLKYVT